MRTILLSTLALTACFGCGHRATQHVTSDGTVLTDAGGFQSPYAAAMRDENYELAASIARKMVDDAPEDAHAWFCLTCPLMLFGDFEAAIECCDKAISIAPNDQRLLYMRGFIAQEQGDHCLNDEDYDEADAHFESAVEYYQQCLAIDSDFADAHYGLAAAHEGLCNDTLVIQHAKRYLDMYPDSPKKDDAVDMIRVAKKYLAEQNTTE